MKVIYITILGLALVACSESVETEENENEPKVGTAPEASQDDLDALYPYSGTANNRKGGAVISTDSTDLWVEGMDYWNDDIAGKSIQYDGDIRVQDDNPVFLDTGGVLVQGIPVSNAEDLEAARDRYWVYDIKYALEK